jgi:hypothetical protein
VVSEEAFHLDRVGRALSKNRARFAALRILWRRREIVAGLAHSFAQQGINMSAYGEAVRARYPR